MNDEIHVVARVEKERARCWPGTLAMTLGQALFLLIYLLMLEQYGFLLLNVNGEEEAIEATADAGG